jgi:hypothetical protein
METSVLFLAMSYLGKQVQPDGKPDYYNVILQSFQKVMITNSFGWNKTDF